MLCSCVLDLRYLFVHLAIGKLNNCKDVEYKRTDALSLWHQEKIHGKCVGHACESMCWGVVRIHLIVYECVSVKWIESLTHIIIILRWVSSGC